MTKTLWESEITHLGEDSGEFIAAGCFILFAEPVSPALAKMSLVHPKGDALTSQLQAGDHFVVGEQAVVLDEIGALAQKNLTELGHVVIYVNAPGQELRPGAVKATAEAIPTPKEGDRIAFVRPE